MLEQQQKKRKTRAYHPESTEREEAKEARPNASQKLLNEMNLAKERTREWVNGASLPPVGEEAPKTRRKGTEEALLPPLDGSASPVRMEKEERMEVNGEFVLDTADFPPIQPTKEVQESETLQIFQGRKLAIPQGRNSREEEEREREVTLIAKFERIVERILDKRLGVPLLSYRQQKEAEKEAIRAHPAKAVPQQKTKAATVGEPKAGAAATTAKPTVKKVEAVKKAIKILPVTTFKPPVRPAIARIPKTVKADAKKKEAARP